MHSVDVDPHDALELLESKFADQEVRSYAVKCLRKMQTEDLLDCVLQLV
jgi:hypothetical protein